MSQKHIKLCLDMIELIRTEQIYIKPNVTLSNLCHISKNLYNEANYLIRQEFFKSRKWIRYYKLDKIMQSSENYKLLSADSAQYTLQIIDINWKSFFKAIKEYNRHPEKFLGIPKLPGYKSKNSEFILKFNNRTKIKNGIITFPEKLNKLQVKTRLSDDINLREVHIMPNGIGYICEIVYKKRITEEGEINKRWYAKNNDVIGIDLGLRNIVTIVNNIGLTPIIIKGGILKNINQYYNKRKSELQSIYDLQEIKYGTKMYKLNLKRNNKIKDQMHKISRFIINYCLKNNIGIIIIGKNNDWKQEINLGKRNNQNFVSIPFNKLIQMIQYKSEEEGIIVKLTEESYTSKCSFSDNESIEYHETYFGKRNRGLFYPLNNIPYNSDVNGALNIIKKAIPNAFAKGIEDVRLHPKRYNIL